MISEILVATLAGMAIGAVRNISGFLENAWKDHKIDSYEWKQLAGTMAFYVGTINIASLALTTGQAAMVALVLDMVRSLLKSHSES